VQPESGYKYEALANEAGVYTLADLLAGTYDFTITSVGFKDAGVKGVELVSRDVRRLDVAIQIGQVATSVESKCGATLNRNRDFAQQPDRNCFRYGSIAFELAKS
jgi:hypothetical protein